MRDIREPSATINPDFAAYTVQTADGSAIVGVFNGEKEGVLRFTDPAGQVHEIPRAKVKNIQALPVSLMPEKLLDVLTPAEQRDLLTFLLQPPFEPAPLVIDGAPAPRKRAEVEHILGSALTASPDPAAKPLRIVLCASEKDASHGKPGYHDYPLWRSRWTRLLNMAEGVTAEPANDWPSEEQWAKADLIIFDSYNPVWALERDDVKISALGEQIDKFLARGGGLVSLHWSLNGGSHPDALAQRLGLAWGTPASKYRHGASDWVLDKNHPLAAGFGEFQIPDESYWHLTGDLAAANASILASSVEEGMPTPQMWTREAGAGRVFVSIPGHFRWTYDDPLYRILIFRGMMWSAHQRMDRLAPLVMVGARVEE
jgi:trehalose utilization protein